MSVLFVIFFFFAIKKCMYEDRKINLANGIYHGAITEVLAC